MSFDYNTLVTDRVKADADARNEKGTYDWRALNRVTEAMEDLHRRFTEYGYATGYVPVRIVHRDGSVSGQWREDDEDMVNINTVIERTLRSFKRSNAFTFWSGNEALPSAESDKGRTWAELDSMNTTWPQWDAADWYLLLYGNLEVTT